jgi:hypothetical protein
MRVTCDAIIGSRRLDEPSRRYPSTEGSPFPSAQPGAGQVRLRGARPDGRYHCDADNQRPQHITELGLALPRGPSLK